MLCENVIRGVNQEQTACPRWPDIPVSADKVSSEPSSSPVTQAVNDVKSEFI